MNRPRFVREFSQAELELFAAYRENRARAAPPECKGGPDCWVEVGPPAIRAKRSHLCVGCQGEPRSLRINTPSTGWK